MAKRKISAPRLERPYRIERSGLSPEAWPDAEPWGPAVSLARAAVERRHEVALTDPGVQERAKQLGMEMRWSTPDEMTARMKSDIARWGAVIANAHIPKR